MTGIRCAAALGILLAWGQSGCTTAYSVRFRDSEAEKPIVGAKVLVCSNPRVVSWLDPRYYLGGDCKTTIVQGRTDSQGEMIAELPSDLGVWCATLDDPWKASMPCFSWTPMRTFHEFYEAPPPKDQIEHLPHRPEVLIQEK